MRHLRWEIATLAIERVPVSLVMASLVVAALDSTEQMQWEIVAKGLEPTPIPPGRYLLDVTTLDGRYLRGEARLVRSIEGTHVLRGSGPLHGLDPAELGDQADG